MKKNVTFWGLMIENNMKSIILLLLLETLIVISSVSIPYFLGDLINSMEQSNINMNVILGTLTIVIVLYALWDVLKYYSSIQFAKVNKSIVNGTRIKCYETIFMSNLKAIIDINDGAILNRIIKDTQSLERCFSSSFNLMMSIMHIAIVFVIMYFINIQITVALLLLFLLVALIQIKFSEALKVGHNNYKQSEEKLFVDLNSFLGAILTLKLFDFYDRAVNFLKINNDNTFNNYVALIKKNNVLRNINLFIISLFRIVPIFLGSYLFTLDLIHIGSIFILYTYAIQLSTQISVVVEMDILLKDVKVSIARLNNFFNMFYNQCEGSKNVGVMAEIKFDNVQFDNNNKQLFDNLNFTAKRGDVIAIKGRNGTGKTTLANIITGVYKLDGVFYNSLASKDVLEASLIKEISYCNQNTSHLPGTIMDNISCFGKVGSEKVKSICKQLGIHDRINQLSDGYNTILNEKNTNISGGEKQMIALARALIKESSVLILDEVDSALDKNLEKLLVDNLHLFIKDKIVFIISHRKVIYDVCNKEICLDEITVATAKSNTSEGDEITRSRIIEKSKSETGAIRNSSGC